MIAASFVVTFAIGCVLGRLYSYVALLVVSPLIALVVAMVAWGEHASGVLAAIFGLCAMALSQVGFLAGVALDPRSGFRHPFARAAREESFLPGDQPSASER